MLKNYRLILFCISVLLSACGSSGGDSDSDDSSGNTPDTTAPVLTLLGNNPTEITVGTSYTDAGATAMDDADGDISADIVTDLSAVDSNDVGSYSVTYDVSDSSGNAATQITRTVNVIDAAADTTAPVITLLGDNPAEIIVGANYTDAGATAMDNVDGDISADIVTDLSAVDSNVVGSYSVTYDVSDAAGNNATQVTRTVNVVAATVIDDPPTVSITAPADDATLSATVTISADASDDDAVSGVQFQLDGNNLGAEDTTAPYSISWDTTTDNNGAHSITAIARDSADQMSSVTINITVSNSGATTPACSDGVDNDGDGLIDFPDDPGCTSAEDTDEFDSFVSFENAKDIANNSVSGVSSLDVGDLNGDGRGDVIALEGGKHASGRKTFVWFEAPATIQGSWTRHEFGNSSQLRSFLGSAKLADMDDDGDLDLIVSSDNHSGSSKQADLYVYVNPGASAVTGTWAFNRVTPSTLALRHINDMEIADMDGDDKLDIIVRSLDPNQIHIFFQNDISSYTRKTIDTNISQSEGLAVGFLDDDGLRDITYTGHWLKSPNNPRTENYTKLNIDSNYKNINQNTKESIGDIDGDGKDDIIISPAEAFRNGGNTYLAWYKNPGNTSSNDWQKNIILDITNNTHTVKLADIDNDGDLDVVTGIGWSNSVSSISIQVYYNDGSGSFSAAQEVDPSKGLYTGVVYDIDGDGDLDIIGQNIYSNSSKPYVYENLLQ